MLVPFFAPQVFSCASFWELRGPVSLEMLVHGETFDFTSDLVGGHNLATLPLSGGSWSIFIGGTVSGGRIALQQ